MPSIQANLIHGLLRIKNFISQPSMELKLEKERTQLDGYARIFKPLVEL
jgi:monoterpene epsilon-lactone hydrolase